MSIPDLETRLLSIEARLVELENLAKESLGIPREMNLSDLQEPPLTEVPMWMIV